MDLPRFLKKLNVFCLPSPVSEVLPGALLSKRLLRREFLLEGHLAQWLQGPPDCFWESQALSANLAPDRLECVVNPCQKGTFCQFGVEIHGLSERSKVSVTITGVRARGFQPGVNRANKFALISLLNNLCRSNQENWSAVQGKWVAMEIYYTTSIMVETASIQQLGCSGGSLRHFGGGRLAWESQDCFTVADHIVPFAFGGFKV